MDALDRNRWSGLLVLGLFAACGGRADRNDAPAEGRGGREAGPGTAQGGTGSGGSRPAGGAGPRGGSAGLAEAGSGGFDAGAGEGGALSAGQSGGGASGQEAGGQEAGGGAGGDASVDPSSVEALLGNYDVYLAAPPDVAGCTVAWHEPRINLTVYRTDAGKLEALPFKDFRWQASFAEEPAISASTVELGALSDWEGVPYAPALTLAWDAGGFLGSGSAEIPYTCSGGVGATRAVAVTLEGDTTSPKLRVDPDGYGSFAFTRFGFTFSEPVDLPNGDYDILFREPADAEQSVELYDTATNATLPTAWKWSLAGPAAQAHFLDLPAVEGRKMAARMLATVRDRAGNPLSALPQTFEIQRAAVLDAELDFDQEPAAGVYGNASYHAAAEPGAECEQGGCLVLDGPVAKCYGEPQSTFAVRLASPWDAGMEIRYRVFASTSGVSPIGIGYASGCGGSFGVALEALAQPEGPFTYASQWLTRTITPCGGPENENGFTLSLGCAEYTPTPDVRVVIERLTRLPSP